MSTTTASLNAPIDSASPTVPSWPVVGTLCMRELVRFFRQKNRVFGALGQPIIFWLLFSEGLRPNGLDYAHFFPGTLVMILLFTAIFATISIIEDRREGFLQGVLVAPITRWSMVLGKVLGGAAIAVLQGLVFLALGWATVESVAPLSVGLVAGLLQGIALMCVLAVALTALGFLIAWRMDSTQGFHAIMSVFLFPMWLLSGAFFPAETGGVLGWIVWANPLTYGVAGLRRCLQLPEAAAEASGNAALVEWASLPPLWVCLVVTLIFAAAMLAACCLVARTRTTGDLR